MGFLGRSCEFHLSRVSTWVLQVGVLGSRSFLIGRTSVGIEVFILRRLPVCCVLGVQL